MPVALSVALSLCASLSACLWTGRLNDCERVRRRSSHSKSVNRFDSAREISRKLANGKRPSALSPDQLSGRFVWNTHSHSHSHSHSRSRAMAVAVAGAMPADPVAAVMPVMALMALHDRCAALHISVVCFCTNS
jgi:hypothetical protein